MNNTGGTGRILLSNTDFEHARLAHVIPPTLFGPRQTHIYMFRTDARLCPVTQPVIPLHNRPSRYPTGSDKQELGRDTLLAEIFFTGEWCYPCLLECAEDLGVWV